MRRPLSVRDGFTRGRAGFTLVELLAVIGIIGVLIAILLPVIGNVRNQGYVADTRNTLAQLGAAIEAYRLEFRAYPGPLSNQQINAASGVVGLPGTQAARITMSENLVLGLLGGLRNNAGAFTYDATLVGSGPFSLNASQPRRYTPYFQNARLSQGQFVDANGLAADDTDIPEFLDRFPIELPILYLRARAGATSSTNTATANAVVTDGSGSRVGQYDVSQYAAYVANPIGQAGTNGHGLRTVTPATVPTITDGRYDAYTYFLSPDFPPFSATPLIPATPRQKDTFILISAGRDRVYGTADDITNFGSISR